MIQEPWLVGRRCLYGQLVAKDFWDLTMLQIRVRQFLGGPAGNYAFLLNSQGRVAYVAGTNGEGFCTSASINSGSWMHFSASLTRQAKLGNSISTVPWMH